MLEAHYLKMTGDTRLVMTSHVRKCQGHPDNFDRNISKSLRDITGHSTCYSNIILLCSYYFLNAANVI